MGEKNVKGRKRTIAVDTMGNLHGISVDEANIHDVHLGSKMIQKMKEKFPNIDFTKSLMVGNRTSDMEFGRNAGLHTVFLATTHPETAFPNSLIDYRFNHLLEFAKAIELIY